MNLQTFIQGLKPEQRLELARTLKTSRAYLSQLGIGHRKASPDLARKLVRASKELFPNDESRWLTLNGVRPDIWAADEAA